MPDSDGWPTVAEVVMRKVIAAEWDADGLVLTYDEGSFRHFSLDEAKIIKDAIDSRLIECAHGYNGPCDVAGCQCVAGGRRVRQNG